MKREFLSLLLTMAMFVCSCSESPVDPGQGDEPQDPNNGTEEPVEPKYKAGEYYKTGLAEGIIAHVDESGDHGLLISVDESYEQWSTDYIMLIVQGGEFSRDNGERNTKYIKSQEN
ncbi:MAG: hypothetical protein UHS52_05640, partial [Alistipes sp.]|nr:hypothetical protein [Alistipes sp.]